MNNLLLRAFAIICLGFALTDGGFAAVDDHPQSPNIVFFLADDWGRDAGCYANANVPTPSDVVKTPNIDRVASEGVRFTNAFYDCPQCTPSRAAITSGCYFWRCGKEAFLETPGWTNPGNLDVLPNFPELLAKAGYATARAFKTLGFAPTMKDASVSGFKSYLRYGLHVSEGKTAEDREQRRQAIIDQTRNSLKKVLSDCPPGKRFFFVFGPINTHRPFAPGSGQALWGINPDSLQGKLPTYLPDVPEVRSDYADYLGEVQALDLMVGIFTEELEKSGQAANTMVVLAGDNGVPGFPHGKTQLYDLGCHAPLIIRWPGHVRPGRTVDDFVTLKDLAPTFLEVAGVKSPATMDARSLLSQLTAQKSGVIETSRDAAIYGRERHAPDARSGNLPYPARAIRTAEFLYIHNEKPERMPFGDAFGVDVDLARAATASGIYGKSNKGDFTPFRDMDASPTKVWLVTHSRDEVGKMFFDQAFGKRPEEELYQLSTDPQQMHNLAASPEYQDVRKKLAARLLKTQQDTRDPRLNDVFDRAPYIQTGKNSPSKNSEQE